MGYKSQPNAQTQYYMGQSATNLYFAGRLVARNGYAEMQDRLGSLGSYYPYGEEYTATTQDQPKFATYYRDQTTVMDYARNRYYSSTMGRFLSADPSKSNALTDPGQWNKYAYVANDPINFNDPSGADRYMITSGLCSVPGTSSEDNPVQYVPCFNIILFSPSPHDGPISGGGSAPVVAPGISAVIRDLKTIYAEDFKNKAKCKDFFNALAKELDPKLGVTGQQLMDEGGRSCQRSCHPWICI